MTEVVYPQEEGPPLVVNLRNPYKAAFLAWLWPGAGHFYQRRYAKGFLFMICILSTYFFGLGLGHGRTVYASFKKGDFRWQYICQLGVGGPSLLALVQSMKTAHGGDPFFVLAERYPANYGNPKNPRFPTATEKEKINLRFRKITPENNKFNYRGKTLKDGLMAPPAGPILMNDPDVLGRWNFEYKHAYEMGVLFTVVAGLLNILAIYDAFVGPAIITPEQREKMKSKKKK